MHVRLFQSEWLKGLVSVAMVRDAASRLLTMRTSLKHGGVTAPPTSSCGGRGAAISKDGRGVLRATRAMPRQRYAPGGGGRKWMLCSAAIATTLSGTCSFML